MITIWVYKNDLDSLYKLVTRLETSVVLDSEIREAYIKWGDQSFPGWIQAQISYSSYLRLKEA